MKIDFSIIPGGRRSWLTVGLVFILGIILFSLLAFLNFHELLPSGWLRWSPIMLLVIALPMERHWNERGALLSVWALSLLAILASYVIFIAGLLLLDVVLDAELVS